MAVTIRPARITDAAVLAQLGAVTFYDSYRAHNTEADMQAYIQKTYSEEVIKINLGQSTVYYVLAFAGEEAVGYCKVLIDAQHPKLTGRIAELEKIYVDQKHIGSGAGKQLIVHVVNWLNEQGFNQLFLGVWQENERALHFYKKAGFEVFDTRSFQLGSRLCEDYMMVLKIG